MTREIAEKIVKGITDKIECNTADIDDWAEFWGFTREEYEDFLEMAIEALQQEPCEDVISRAEVLSHAKTEWGNGHEQPFDYVEVDVIKQLPPVTPQYTEAEIQRMQELEQAGIQKAYELGKAEQQKMGHWITVDKGLKVTSFKCSECGRTVRDDTGYDVTKDYPYCHCGAKMQEVQK